MKDLIKSSMARPHVRFYTKNLFHPQICNLKNKKNQFILEIFCIFFREKTHIHSETMQ